MGSFSPLVVPLGLVAFCAVATAGLRPVRLRCEYRVNPLGVDVARPRLSWVPEATTPAERGQHQTAYQILAASNPQALAGGKGDLWDTGKVASGQTIQIEYRGKPLSSRMRCHWKVRLWDAQGKPGPWSETALWSAGLLERGDWSAKWISNPAARVPADADERSRKSAHYGYRSASSRSGNQERAVTIDLGSVETVDEVRLYPAQSEPGGPVYRYPRRFRVEAAAGTDFAVVADRMREDQAAPSPGQPAVFRFAPVQARYVRLTATETRRDNEITYLLALAEMEVLASGRNVARGATVTAETSNQSTGWSRAFLVDGRTAPVETEPVRQPAPLFRKPFQVSGDVRRATAYVTARGVYELRLNGTKVGDQILAPEWTGYHKRIQYQAYDVTAQVRPGGNVLGAYLGAGWYAGRVGLFAGRGLYGKTPALLVRLEVELADGQPLAVVSDESWRTTTGPVVSSDILDGEIYDARNEIEGWETPGFGDSSWTPAVADCDLGAAALVWQPNEPIRVTRELKPVRISKAPDGSWVFDMGQNMVGWCRLRTRGEAGQTITLRHVEAIDEAGYPYYNNLRGASPIDRFTLCGSGEETFEPRFTYHGFRYVVASGLTRPPDEHTILGRVFHSSSPDASRFESSSPLFNQLISNIVWTQRANLQSSPNDCPQRDERLGWTGDIQAFSQTAAFNMDMAGFFTKFLRDMRDDQTTDGRYPDFSPNPNSALGVDKFYGVPAWGDAGVVVAWSAWQNYGDRRLLEEHFESARRWVEFIRSANPNLLWEKSRGNDYGDWLNADTIVQEGWPAKGGEAPKALVGTAFFAHSTELVSRMAAVLGRREQAASYKDLFEQIKSAFQRAYLKPGGLLESDTQAAYSLALHFNLLPESERAAALQHMLDGFGRYDGHLSTGFLSTHRLLFELARAGRYDDAYRLLNLRTFPSWGFMIENGATTIWERWDGFVKGRGFQDPGMNSFNHWAFGAVGEWMWKEIIGINPDDEHPAYQRFAIRPRPGGGLTWAKGSYESIRGPIRVWWRLEGDAFLLDVSVPPNTTATVHVPDAASAKVTESGKPAAHAKGVLRVRDEEQASIFEVGSGEYRFRSPAR
ncbi:MAG: family 78 glycoside hydrolase catalytic domain [Bryobacteraceae bacterium]